MSLQRAIGCQIYKTEDPNSLKDFAEKYKEQKILVLHSPATNPPADAQIKANSLDLSLKNISNGIDSLVNILKNEDEQTFCIFVANDIEATTGMVLACCLKSAKTIKKMKDMISEGITEKEWTEKLIQNTFENGKSSFTDLDVISSLVKQLESGPVGKLLADKMIDICGETLNLRKNIDILKEKYDAANSDDIKKKTLEAVEIYLYLVCFGCYVRDCGDEDFSKTFTTWFQEKPFISSLIQNGIRCWEDMTFFLLK